LDVDADADADAGLEHGVVCCCDIAEGSNPFEVNIDDAVSAGLGPSVDNVDAFLSWLYNARCAFSKSLRMSGLRGIRVV
jgi:hypothetical protein